MGFHEVRFPDNIAYGSMGGPGASTQIIETDSGAEERIPRWSEHRSSYDVSYGIRDINDLQLVKEFYIARRGPAFGFRYKDFFDFTTAANGRDIPFAHTTTDQVIGSGDGSEVNFQLSKDYISGPVFRRKKITKPVDGTVLVSLDDVDQAGGWSVNTATGIITFTAAPGAGVVVKAGCQFDVPVRFGKEVDEVLSASYDFFDTGSISSIPLIELLDATPISDEFYFGGAKQNTFSADMTLVEINGRAHGLNPQINNLKVYLPPTADLPKGAPYFYLRNESLTNNFLLRNENDGAVATITPGMMVTVVLGLDSVGAATWYAYGA